MPSTDIPAEDVYTSRFNRVLAIGLWVIFTLIAVSLFFASSASSLLYLIPIAFVVVLMWELMWRPSLTVVDSEIEVQNPLRTVHIPWNALVHFDTKFALRLFTPGHTYEVWAAPAPGRSFGFRSSSASRQPERGAAFSSGSVRPSDMETSDSGEAAGMVRRRWDALQATGAVEAGIADRVPVRIQWHWRTIVVLGVLLIASVPALLVA